MKKLFNQIISTLFCFLVVGAIGFFVTVKISMAVYDVKFENVEDQYAIILEKLKSIDNKLDRHIERGN